jgi:GNAT superfamily N-acetyltransferase
MNLDIRPGRVSDLDALCAIDSHLAAGNPERARDIARWLHDDEAYVALTDGRPCGYAALGDSMFCRSFIHMLMVGEASRGKGVGTRLVAHFEERIEGPEFWTSTNRSNLRMQGLLASRCHRLTGFIDDLDPGDPELFYFRGLPDCRTSRVSSRIRGRGEGRRPRVQSRHCPIGDYQDSLSSSRAWRAAIFSSTRDFLTNDESGHMRIE